MYNVHPTITTNVHPYVYPVYNKKIPPTFMQDTRMHTYLQLLDGAGGGLKKYKFFGSTLHRQNFL